MQNNSNFYTQKLGSKALIMYLCSVMIHERAIS